MRRIRMTKLLVNLILGIAGLFPAAVTFAQDEIKVEVKDLETRKCVVNGKLGLPIGTVLKIRGNWATRPHSDIMFTKGEPLRVFCVTHVNEKKLDRAVDFLDFLVEGSKEALEQLQAKKEHYCFESLECFGVPPNYGGGGAVGTGFVVTSKLTLTDYDPADESSPYPFGLDKSHGDPTPNK